VKNKFVLFFIIFSLAITSCKKNDNPANSENNPPLKMDSSNYFPANTGNYYEYNFERTNSNYPENQGVRKTRYSATSEMGGIYNLQTDSIFTGDSTSVYTSLFRRTGTGVFYYLDTSGFSANLPPEYSSFIPYLKFDPEMRLLTSPLYEGQTWPVFKVNLEQTINVTIVDVEAKYIGKENIDIPLSPGLVTKPAVKIEYDFSVINPVTKSSQTVTVDGWFAADIGAVKWEGNGLLLNVFTRGEINFADSTSTGTENLVKYNIR
jgi:hypothetical protein